MGLEACSQEEVHAWFCKLGQQYVVEEAIDFRGKSTIAALINRHVATF